MCEESERNAVNVVCDFRSITCSSFGDGCRLLLMDSAVKNLELSQ